MEIEMDKKVRYQVLIYTKDKSVFEKKYFDTENEAEIIKDAFSSFPDVIVQIDKQILQTSMMGGEFWENEDTPFTSSPRSETYWSS